MKEILLSAYSEFIFNIKKGQRFSYYKRNLHFQPLKQSVDRNKQITYIEYSETSPYGHLVITTAFLWPKQMAMDWSAILFLWKPHTDHLLKPFNPKISMEYFLHCYPYIFYVTGEANFLNNQDLFRLVDHFLSPCRLYVWYSSVAVRRNWMLVTFRG